VFVPFALEEGRMRLVAAAAVLATACVPSTGPTMAPYQDCLTSECHGAGGEGKRWTVAGTWPGGEKVRVTVVDATGKSITMRANQVGNFYTAESLATPTLAQPWTVYVDQPGVARKTMPASPALTYGGCNSCHTRDGVIALANMNPGQDCLACHDGTTAVKFYAAGTFAPQGQTVTINGANVATTNAVGNFYVRTPIQLPYTAGVGGRTMEPPQTYGGCNAAGCHAGGSTGGD
jgi:hypothetical protein